MLSSIIKRYRAKPPAVGFFAAVALPALIVSGCSMNSSRDRFTLPSGLEPPESRFERAPDIGQEFPDITIVDDAGQPVNVRSLAGEKPYTVLTIGCLT